eukprot:TRINITY_DN18458_c3_g2_i1.p1 TRINITY_DN18458_c3_g2~~TRINITY_DN18458_c3_g2_i1.p1  ORF type:complete len:451 (-),score=80.82 TRINITY_DN18458_c3_g2_i1:216-1568(-)
MGRAGAREAAEIRRVEPTTILLCRHGETDWNLEKRFQGSNDIPLNAAGQDQARQIAAHLKSLRGGVAAVVASPLLRTSQTAEEAARALGLPLSLDNRLRERDLGRMQGLTSQEVRTRYPQYWTAWTTTGMPFPEDAGVESGPDAVARIESALFDLAAAHPGKTVLVVSHGALIRVLLHRAVGTASITTLVVGPGRSWRLVKVNDAEHLGGLRGLGFFQDADTQEWGGGRSTTTVVVCRHGETDWNLERRFQGVEDIPLNAMGCEQALLLANVLKEQEVSAIWCSPLLRARETGMAIAAASGVQFVTDARLIERNLGVLQARTPTELEEQYPEVIAAWRAQVPLPPESRAESSENVVTRVESALYDVAAAYPGKKVVFVLHGAMIRCLLKRAVGLARIETPKNVSLTTITVGPGRHWHLAQVTQSSHMPKSTKDEIEHQKHLTSQRAISRL